MARFSHILFVCQKQRDPDDPKGCCKRKGSAELLDRLKALTKEHRLKGKVRVTASGCLDYCAKGITVAAFSEDLGESWYTRLTPDEADALFETHVLAGRPYEPKLEK